MLKRLVAAGSVSIMALVGFAPGASAASTAPSHQVKIVKAIDWDAPSPALGDSGASTQRIDWD